MLALGSGPAFEALTGAGLELESARARVEEFVGTGPVPVEGYVPLTPRARNVLEGSAAEADRLGRREIGPEHVLLRLLGEVEGGWVQVLAARGLEHLRAEVFSRLDPEREYPGGMFERFTDRARRVVVLAKDEAERLQHASIGPEHLLLGLVEVTDGLAGRALAAVGVTLEGARAAVETIAGTGDRAPEGHIPFTPQAKHVLEGSLKQALRLGHAHIGTEHILLSLLKEAADDVPGLVLQRLGVDRERVREDVLAGLGQTPEEGGARGPRCPSCAAPLGLAGGIRAARIDAEDEGGARVAARLFYCGRCGHPLGMTEVGGA